MKIKWVCVPNETIIYKGGDRLHYKGTEEPVEVMYLIGTKIEILSEEIDIDDIFRIEKDERGREYVSYKNDGVTESGFSGSYSSFDRWVVKAVKQLDKKIK